MAQTGYTPILIYGSGTTGNTPSAGNLTSSSAGAELAINYFDGKLFYKDASGVVQVLATKGTGAIGGSNTQVQYNSSGALAGSANFTYNGTSLSIDGSPNLLLLSSNVERGRIVTASGAVELMAGSPTTPTISMSSSVATFTNNPVMSGGTANGVTYLNASKALTSGSALTFDGTTLTANSATVSTGNLTFSGTAQRITGDMSNATVANRLMFQTSTSNNTTVVGAVPNGTGTEARLSLFNNSDPTLSSGFDLRSLSTEAQLRANNYGGGNLPMTFYTGGSERVRIDTSGNVGIGRTPTNFRFEVAGRQWVQDTTQPSTYWGNTLSDYLVAYYDTAGKVGNFSAEGASTQVAFRTANTERMRIDSSGNVGIGTATTGSNDRVRVEGAEARIRSRNSTSGAEMYMGSMSPNEARLWASTSSDLTLGTNNAERMRIDSSGNIVAGASAALATNATNGFLYVPTCAGTPTGTPTAITGMAPIVVDTTNNKLYFYSTGQWRDAGP